MPAISPLIFVSMFVLASAAPRAAQDFSSVILFQEDGFPAVDTAAPRRDLGAQMPGARIVNASSLPGVLAAAEAGTLVLPYGSVFPESAWPATLAFLQRGGNLVALGGRPFTRAAYRDEGVWKLRAYSTRFTRPLMIDQYQETLGSEGSVFQTNGDAPLTLPAFSWARAFSPVIRLSAVDLYKRGGSAGALDARLDPLAWGVKDGRRMSAPVMVVDHWRTAFPGGRWVLAPAELGDDFQDPARGLIAMLTALAMRGSQEFAVRPRMPLYLAGEPIELDIVWKAAQSDQGASVTIAIQPEGDGSKRQEQTLSPVPASINLAARTTRGLHVVEATLVQDGKVRAKYRSGFWIRDLDALRSGPRLTVNTDYFELDGRPLAVVGTTHMSSEVQRLYFEYPNVDVWDRDLAHISDAGLNMIRTGWWTGWDRICDEQGHPTERTLRTIEAYLLTARRHNLPVQFTFFAFLPEVLGGGNPYLDPVALERQRTLVGEVVARFHEVPWLAWDFINEPSISRRLWSMRPGGDQLELALWNEWIAKRYPDRAALAAAWNLPADSATGAIPLPTEDEFNGRGVYSGRNSLKMYDFHLFAQDVFTGWVKSMREVVRGTGSTQLVTVGQDEGGIQDRLSPAFWGEAVDFTTNHSWWQNDHLLWDSLVPKEPGQPMLVQETGLQRELTLDEVARRTPESEAALLERKVATSFVGGAGAIEWLWHTNSYMTESNETPIGAVRTDGTEKPEADVMRRFAVFAGEIGGRLKAPTPPPVAIVMSLAAQFSVNADLQLEAQRNAVRALGYYARFSGYAVAENHLDRLGRPALVILPSAQALTENAWRSLLGYVDGGGQLLVTGPIERDEHWQMVSRIAPLLKGAVDEPLVTHNATLQLASTSLALTFTQQKQSVAECLRFPNGSTFEEIAHGKGRIFWAAWPVELAEGARAAGDLYSFVASRVGLEPVFDLGVPLSPGVLVQATPLADAVFYVFASDDAESARIDLKDRATGAKVSFTLPAQHAAMALIDRKTAEVVATVGVETQRR
jgi:hypothetical protein